MASQADLQATAETLESTLSVDARRADTDLRYTTAELASGLALPEDEVEQAMSKMATKTRVVDQDGDDWVVRVS